MITIPSVLCYKDIVVYPDDKDCNLFYCIRTTPKIRMENGSPVFSGLFYTDDLSGTMKSVAGLAGACINFDVNLAISDEDYDKIREQIKSQGIQEARVNAIKKKNEERYYYLNRNKESDASSSNLKGFDTPTIGEIHFGSINFKNGTVELLEEKADGGGALIAWSDSGAQCSGFGDNNAAFALSLTPLGGAVWYKALQERSKAFSVRYNLKFEVRVPCLEIHIYASSLQNVEMLQKVLARVDNNCVKAEMKKIAIPEVTQTLIDESIIHIDVVQGSSDIPMEDVQRIQQSMVSIVQKKIEEIIKTKIEGMTREEMNKTLILKMKDEIDSFAELRFTQESVMEWSVAPQCTIMNFLEGVSEEYLKKHIINLVDISDPVVPTVVFKVNVDAPWDEAPNVTFVNVMLEYVATGEKKEFLFTNEKRDTQEWSYRPVKEKMTKKDEGIVRYSAKVWTKDTIEKEFGGEGPFEIPVRETKERNILFNVGKIGVADITFAVDPSLSTLTGNNQVTSIVVKTRYRTKEERLEDEKDKKLGIVQEEKRGFGKDCTVDLNTGKYHYQANYKQPINEPLLYQTTYSFRNRTPIIMPEQQYYFSQGDVNEVVLTKPFSDLKINVDASNSIRSNQNIIGAIVKFIYKDEKEDFESSARVELSKEQNWESGQASLLVLDKTNKSFKYKYTLQMTDNEYQSDWMEVEDGQEQIMLTAPKAFTVDTGLFGTAGKDYYRAELKVDFKNEGVEELKFEFSKNESNEIRYWYIPQKLSGIELSFSYVFKYYDLRGREYEISGENTGNLLMIVKPESSESPETPIASETPETND